MIIAKLADIEWLKARKRLGFWMGMLFFVGMLAIGFGVEFYLHVQNPAQRSGAAQWSDAAEAGSSIGLLIVMILVVLLTASEKTWRTERQNVIDGLSRTQYFSAKLLLVLMVAALIWLISALYGVVFSVLERGLVDVPRGEFMSGLDVSQMSGLLLYLLLVGCIALFFGTVASSSGAALALAFVLILIQPMVMLLMSTRGGFWQDATAYMPMQIMGSLVSRDAHDAAAFAERIERMRQASMNVPLSLPASRAALVAVVYIALLSAGAWLSIRRRDL